MAIALPEDLVEFILLGPEDDRRQLQDSPILGDVWLAFGRAPDARLELLITPYRDSPAGKVATHLAACFKEAKGKAGARAEKERPDVAYLHGIVAAKLSFPELVRYVVPMTTWWQERNVSDAIRDRLEHPGTLKKDLNRILHAYSDRPGSVTMQ